MPQLDREEYIEQAYFWSTFLERHIDGVPAQEILAQVGEELLSTTRLPMAVDFLLGELRHRGRLGEGMALMSHYFAPFQAMIMQKAEDERIRFDTHIAIRILRAESEYRAAADFTPAGLFLFQFECITRNRLGYHDGMQAIAGDPVFDETWQHWVLWLRQQLGSAEFCEFVYLRSEFAVEEKRRLLGDPDWQPDTPQLFGRREGRIAKANRGKDPMYLFASMQRQLGYPAVPRPDRREEQNYIHPVIEQRLQLLEKRLSLMEQMQNGGIDLSPFMKQPDPPGNSPAP